MKNFEDYTLGEINQECLKVKGKCSDCNPKINKICTILDESPDIWEVDMFKKEFSNDELACMRILYKIGARYITRDKSSSIDLYRDMPTMKRENYWEDLSDFSLPYEMFPQIQWEDEDATCIADYIGIEE